MIKKIKRTVRISRYVIYKETLVNKEEHFWSFIGAFVGIGIISFLQKNMLDHITNIFLIGSFGASSVLIYGAIESPMAQPRNLIGGHLVSAFIGVTVQMIFPETLWIAAPLAVASSIVCMQLSKTMHPPGGATALIAIIGTEKVKTLGYVYILSPVLSGAVILFITALIFNNITSKRKYPTHSRITNYLKNRINR
ncbi:HPP family protein [Zhouia sp. PK063]|uniref:HPP family protein n=1 Tax=Zhouia sp. PK063 TaxID=3373602 RepID=UPI0037A738CE